MILTLSPLAGDARERSELAGAAQRFDGVAARGRDLIPSNDVGSPFAGTDGGRWIC